MTTELKALIERFDHLRDSGVCSPTTRGLLDDAQSLLSTLSTPTAEDAREAEMRELHHFEVEQQLVETIAIVKRAQAAVLRHEHTPASLHMDAILDEVNTEIPSGAEVRPRGTVTDAEVEAAVEAYWKADDPTGGPVSMRAALEAAREARS